MIGLGSLRRSDRRRRGISFARQFIAYLECMDQLRISSNCGKWDRISGRATMTVLVMTVEALS